MKQSTNKSHAYDVEHKLNDVSEIMLKPLSNTVPIVYRSLEKGGGHGGSAVPLFVTGGWEEVKQTWQKDVANDGGTWMCLFFYSLHFLLA